MERLPSYVNPETFHKIKTDLRLNPLEIDVILLNIFQLLLKRKEDIASFLSLKLVAKEWNRISEAECLSQKIIIILGIKQKANTTVWQSIQIVRTLKETLSESTKEKSSQKPINSIDLLPEEILLKIFLDTIETEKEIPSLGTISLVSRCWRRVSSDTAITKKIETILGVEAAEETTSETTRADWGKKMQIPWNLKKTIIEAKEHPGFQLHYDNWIRTNGETNLTLLEAKIKEWIYLSNLESFYKTISDSRSKVYLYSGEYKKDFSTEEKIKCLQTRICFEKEKYPLKMTFFEPSNVTNMTFFDFNHKCTALPPEIACLTQLHTLNIKKSILKSLPPEIGCLTQLIQLSIEENDLKCIPPEIGRLTNLTILRLKQNSLRFVQSEIFNLIKLVELDVSKNKLMSIPSEIGKLTNLKNLVLFSNQLESLPPEMGKLTSLQYLRVDVNPLESIPNELGQCENIMDIRLTTLKISWIPVSIIQLPNLLEECRKEFENVNMITMMKSYELNQRK